MKQNMKLTQFEIKTIIRAGSALARWACREAQEHISSADKYERLGKRAERLIGTLEKVSVEDGNECIEVPIVDTPVIRQALERLWMEYRDYSSWIEDTALLEKVGELQTRS